MGKKKMTRTPSLFADLEEEAPLPPEAKQADQFASPDLLAPDPFAPVITLPPLRNNNQSAAELLESLNGPQQRAVTTTEGPVLILAGPGSGKTRVITHRIAYLITHAHVPPTAILAVTFTNKAAREMRSRLEDLVGVTDAGQMVLGTFHSLSARMLRRAPAAFLAELGLTASFSILDDDDALRVMKEAMRRMQHELTALSENEEERAPGALLDQISRLKNDMIGPERLAQDATSYREVVFAALYRRYQQLLRIANSVDFDDLLVLAEYLLRSDSETRRRYQQRWSYLHVDEFQDCNLPQYRLVRLLAAGTDAEPGGLGNVCVVGDDDQMIYTWRGASIENIQRFERDFPQATTVVLEQNYRSTKTILAAAQALVAPIAGRYPKQLWTHNDAGCALRLVTARDEEAEARFLAQELLRLHADGASWEQMAVLYRTNAQSRAIEEALLRAAIPYAVTGSRSFCQIPQP